MTDEQKVPKHRQIVTPLVPRGRKRGVIPMTGLDSPEWRRKIYRLLCSMTVPGEDSTMSASKYWQEERYRITDQLVALYPDIEEIRKQEMERIIKLLPVISVRYDHNKTCFDCIANIKRQSLKSE